MKLRLLILFICTIVGWKAEAQSTIAGVTLPTSLKVDDTELTLNGRGIRKKLFFNLYTGGLYLPAKSKRASDIVANDKATGFRLVITSALINSTNMSEAVERGFLKSMKGNIAPLRAKIDQFLAPLKAEEIKEGDIFDLVYVPGIGLKALKNGKLKTTITGLEFKKALFGIWLGENPVDIDLKNRLLGG